MIRSSLRLHRSTRQIDKSKYFCIKLSDKSLFFFLIMSLFVILRYNKLAREWTQRYAMWQKNIKQQLLPELLNRWQYCSSAFSTLVVTEVFNMLNALSLLRFYLTYPFYYFGIIGIIILNILFEVLRWSDCMFLWTDLYLYFSLSWNKDI